MIEYRCEHCGEGVAFPEDAAGGERACPHCGKTVKVPAGAVPGFPVGVQRASAKKGGETPAAHTMGPHAPSKGTAPVSYVLWKVRQPPTEELNLCIFLKWLLLVGAFAAALVRVATGVRWYMRKSVEMDVEGTALVWVFVDMFWIVILGLICYTVLACLAQIVGGLYTIQKQMEQD